MQSVFLYLGAALTAIWGIAHLIPTKDVVAGFGDISEDNRHIITMEWIVEGVSLILMGSLVAIVTFIDPQTVNSTSVYIMSATGLLILALISN